MKHPGMRVLLAHALRRSLDLRAVMVLLVLDTLRREQEGQISTRDLAHATGLPLTAVSRAVWRLKKVGMVSMTQHASDHRRVNINTLAPGRRVIEAIRGIGT